MERDNEINRREIRLISSNTCHLDKIKCVVSYRMPLSYIGHGV